MRVLAVLAETPGEVVSRADLFEAVWADTVVNDEALTRAVSELRKALGDDAPGAIETIRGTGYRLALPIEPLAPPAPSPPPEAIAEKVRAPARSARSGSLVTLALGLSAVALAVAVWAAWPREAPEASGEVAAPVQTEVPRQTLPPEAVPDGREPIQLDSTSPYYRPGMSELGVYYDSTADAYFRFVE